LRGFGQEELALWCIKKGREEGALSDNKIVVDNKVLHGHEHIGRLGAWLPKRRDLAA
jgi:hypothetical protein